MLLVDVNVCTNLPGDMRPNIVHGPLDCRNIKFMSHIIGDSVLSLNRAGGMVSGVAPILFSV